MNKTVTTTLPCPGCDRRLGCSAERRDMGVAAALVPTLFVDVLCVAGHGITRLGWGDADLPDRRSPGH